MDRFFDDQHFEPHVTMVMASNKTIKQAVMAGMGMTLLSLHTVGLEVRTGVLKMAVAVAAARHEPLHFLPASRRREPVD